MSFFITTVAKIIFDLLHLIYEHRFIRLIHMRWYMNKRLLESHKHSRRNFCIVMIRVRWKFRRFFFSDNCLGGKMFRLVEPSWTILVYGGWEVCVLCQMEASLDVVHHFIYVDVHISVTHKKWFTYTWRFLNAIQLSWNSRKTFFFSSECFS